MKTIQKTIALSIATLAASLSFGQVGLGVTSTTQAAVNATANTAGIVQTTHAATSATMAATRSTVNSAVVKTTDVKMATATTVNAGARQATGTAGNVKTDLGNPSNISAGVGANGSTQTIIRTDAGGGSPGLGVAATTGTSAGLQVNGSQAVDHAGAFSANLVTSAEDKTDATVEATNKMKAGAETEVRSGLQAAKPTTPEVKTDAGVKVAAKSETRAAVTKQ